MQYFVDLFQGFQSATCVAFSTTIPEESLMSDFVNPLYFSTAAGVLKKHCSLLFYNVFLIAVSLSIALPFS